VPKIFVSNECSVDNRVAEIIARLRSCPDVRIDQSPLNPSVGEDARWRDWYARGCTDAIAWADCFVAVVTPSYDCSSWMAHEFDVALKRYRQHARPYLFLAKQDGRALPLGFKHYEDAATILSGSPDTAVAQLLAHVGAVAGPTGEVAECGE
jgi:hypothetical protein